MPMELTDDQKKTVSQWVQGGMGLSEVQKKILSEFKISMTFIDVRMLVLELGVAVKDARSSLRPEPAKTAPGAPAGALDPAEPEVSSGVSVEVDRLMKPGALVSGSVVFSDGTRAKWSLDQTGRLALQAAKPGYQPPPEDIQAFQLELRRALEKKGF